MNSMMRNDPVATEGNEVASSFHDREAAIRCWRHIVENSGLQDKELADAAGMTPSYFSKVSAGVQGDLLGMVVQIGHTYPALRRRFIVGLAVIEGADPLAEAAEQLIAAASRFLRLQTETFPMRMARASLTADRKQGVA